MLSIEEIKKFINEDQITNKKQQARTGLRYYNGEHDIKNYRVFYFDEEGNPQEDKTKSNIKISHPFFKELCEQCTSYMLSGNNDFVKSDIPELQNLLNEYIDDDFKAELSELLTYTKVEGFSYLYRYINEDFRSAFKFADGLHVIECDKKYTSDNKDYIIYTYFYKKDKDKNIYKIEVWDEQFKYNYLMTDNKITKDENYKIPHITYEEDGQTYYEVLGQIPFIRMDNNRYQTSDLNIIKNLIDDYDLMSCGLSNNLQDMAEGIYVVKGFEGSDLSELTQSIRVKKQIGVGEKGDLDIKTINVPYQARLTKLELDEKNIYRFGMGFNSNQLGDGNVTNVVIKSRYALLDLKCNALEKQLRKLMKKILKIIVDEINEKNKTNYSLKDTYMIFERKVITNELDNAQIDQIKAQTKQIELTSLLNIATKLDDETIIENICQVLEIDYEEIKDKIPKETIVDIDRATQTIDQINEVVENE